VVQHQPNPHTKVRAVSCLVIGQQSGIQDSTRDVPYSSLLRATVNPSKQMQVHMPWLRHTTWRRLQVVTVALHERDFCCMQAGCRGQRNIFPHMGSLCRIQRPGNSMFAMRPRQGSRLTNRSQSTNRQLSSRHVPHRASCLSDCCASRTLCHLAFDMLCCACAQYQGLSLRIALQTVYELRSPGVC
jgi:hypothetical protein